MYESSKFAKKMWRRCLGAHLDQGIRRAYREAGRRRRELEACSVCGRTAVTVSG